MTKYLFILFIFIVSCNEIKQDINNISFYNGVQFMLDVNENIGMIEKSVNANYNNFFDSQNPISIPLYKYINGGNYQFFIGIALLDTIALLDSTKVFKSDSFLKLEKHTDSTSFFYQNYQQKQQYIATYFVSINGNKFFLMGLTSDSIVFENKFNLNSMQKRFQIQENL